MPGDPVVSRELSSLREEIAESQRARQSSPPDRPNLTDAIPRPISQAEETAEEHQLRRELREFVDEVTKFFEEAEKNVAANPTASVVGALVLGILIGRFLRQR